MLLLNNPLTRLVARHLKRLCARAVTPIAAAHRALQQWRVVRQTRVIKVCTFDSGFGGYLTAKAFERLTTSFLLPRCRASFSIRHFADTLYGPYGSRTPEEIIQPAARHIVNALESGTKTVMIACNTVSAHADAIRKEVSRVLPGRAEDVLTVIDATMPALQRKIGRLLRDDRPVHLLLTATPATLHSDVYIQKLNTLYRGTQIHGSLAHGILVHGPLHKHNASGGRAASYTRYSRIRIDSQRIIHVYSLAPGTWVDLIESGADLRKRREAAVQDVAFLTKILPPDVAPDILGEFCTHYPVFYGPFITALDEFYRSRGVVCAPERIHQAELAARLLAERASVGLPTRHIRRTPSAAQIASAAVRVAVSGDDLDTIRNTARLMFPTDPMPKVYQLETPGFVDDEWSDLEKELPA